MAATTQAAPVTLPMAKLRSNKPRTLWRDAWSQFRKNKLAIVGMTVLILLIVGVIVGPFFYTVDPERIDIIASELSPTWAAEHPFGTDDLGRDTLARNLHGGRISLAVGVTAMLIAMTFGTLVGLLSGFIPSLDGPLMRFTDLMFALPQLPLLLVIIMLFRDTLRGIFGPEIGIFILVVFVIGILGWMPTARIVRGSVLSIKEKEFVEAADCIGVGRAKIMFKHILPNVMSPIIVSATLGVASAILTESALSFLGLGFPSDVPTWGRLLFDGRDFMTRNPWLVFWPGLFISLTILSINFMGDGLRDALDPRLRQ
ncbi:MAG: ABC transporter permease [Caldilineaceae bacterium]|nr:ABC transporter permease [Caldilineaceae bacterium]MCB0121005.1 ABC transporter permease [Caldilineaceae bacterium]MCB0183450.1 ABC transporter permease [Caldilineaceae bacterium]